MMKRHEIFLVMAMMLLKLSMLTTTAFLAPTTRTHVPFVSRFDATTMTTTTTTTTTLGAKRTARKIAENEVQNKKISKDRRKKLGIADDEDEYDLDIALENSTDPFITKVIAGSLILTILVLLVAGIVVPATTDYGDGVCNPLLTGGRC